VASRKLVGRGAPGPAAPNVDRVRGPALGLARPRGNAGTTAIEDGCDIRKIYPKGRPRSDRGPVAPVQNGHSEPDGTLMD